MTDEPIRVIWDKEGYNQWGTKYISPRRCFVCDSDIPLGNMYGMDERTCPKCGINQLKLDQLAGIQLSRESILVKSDGFTIKTIAYE
jgi:hypothetical protein